MNPPKIILHVLDKTGSGIAAGQWNNGVVEEPHAFEPHRHDHYTCMLLEEGEMEVLLDFEKLTMQSHTLFISYPGQVHQVLSSSFSRGWYISFANNLIEESVRITLDRSLAEVVTIELKQPEFEWFRSIIYAMIQLSAINHEPPREVGQSLLMALISQASEMYKHHVQRTVEEQTPRAQRTVRRLRNLVRTNFRTLKRPSAYADQLNITVSYLNDIVKKSTGLSVSDMIKAEIINEAQRLLYYTDLSVKEIAVNLGYDDYKYFIRLYSKSTGVSPARSRKQPNSITSHA